MVVVREKFLDTFGQQWIARYGPMRWPPRSPDPDELRSIF